MRNRNRTGDWRSAPPRDPAGRPRLAFFRPNRGDLPAFVQQHFDEHVRCLEFFFDVVLIEENCSYDEVCGRLQVDLALFESGVYVRSDRRITDTHRHPSIPKAGFLNADAYCVTRSVFLSDMDEWGVENFFTISMSLASRVPQLRDRLFVWPNFADIRRFHTYPGGKQTPILFTGSLASNYPWRNRINHLLGRRFPIVALPHGGWFNASQARNVLYGESYARALSSSLIVPTCGTIAHELVRKHLEIPACGALLLTERTAAVEAAGFTDMETCVYADETDVVDKVEHLLAHPEEIERISSAGQHLARTRHDMAHRNQIFQWFELTKRCTAGETITQPDPFGDMVLRPKGCRATQAPEMIVGRDSALVDAADRASAAGLFEGARAGYHAVLNYHYEAEAAIGMARTALRCGDAALARKWVWDSIVRCIHLRAKEPDPVEWSVYILALLCAGRIRGAIKAAGRYDLLTHVELARVRHLLHRLTRKSPAPAPDRCRSSVHRDRNLSWPAWVDDAARMLDACGQVELARRARAIAGDAEPSQALSSLRAAAGPRRVGRQLSSLRYYHHYHRIRSRLAQLYRRRASALANPFPEMLGGRGIRTVMLVGISPEDGVGALARNACRRSPEPYTLITVGDLPGPGIPPARALGRGSNALGDGAPLRIGLTDRTAIIIGQPATGLVSLDVCLGAKLVVLTHLDEKSLPVLAARLDATPFWKRASLPASAGRFGLAAWEPDD